MKEALEQSTLNGRPTTTVPSRDTSRVSKIGKASFGNVLPLFASVVGREPDSRLLFGRIQVLTVPEPRYRMLQRDKHMFSAS